MKTIAEIIYLKVIAPNVDENIPKVIKIKAVMYIEIPNLVSKLINSGLSQASNDKNYNYFFLTIFSFHFNSIGTNSIIKLIFISNYQIIKSFITFKYII